MTVDVPVARMWLVRHAETAWTGRRWCGRADPPLTAAGLAAARRLGDELDGDMPTDAVIVASPARRARATADAIAARAGGTVVVEPLLLEVDFGHVEGLTWGEIVATDAKLADRILSRAAIDWPGGETATEIAARAVAAARRLTIIRVGRPIVVVSHSAFLDALGRTLGVAEDARGLAPCGVRLVA